LSAWITPEDMKTRMEYYRNFIRNVPMADGAASLVFPGEMEANQEKKRRVEGIPVPVTTIETLNKLKAEYGVTACLEEV
ncbi:MAG: Ldh family oxidoreductase, partial [Lentisphaeria bacterium]|nr:Ldh family oxidoreductase [Lentisphaeria bacterium]